MRLQIVAAVLLVLTAGPVWAENPLAEADKAFSNAEFQRAAKLYAAAADNEPDAGKRAEIRVRLAVTFLNMRSRAKAEKAVAQALKDNPQLELIPDFYTADFLKLVARVKARLAAAAPPAPSPTPTPPPDSLPQIRQRLAQATDNAAVEALLPSIDAFEAAAPANQRTDVLEVKADALERLGHTGEALELHGRVGALRAAAQAAPGTSPVPLETLLEARRLLAAGRPMDAVSLLRGVLAAQPSCVPAFEVLAEAYLDAGRLDEAYNALRTALLGNEKPELLLALGEVELRRGRFNGARDAFRRVVEVDPGNDRAWAALGLLASRMGDQASARDALDKALAANPMLFEARVVRAEIALADGQPAAALAHLQRALQVKPGDPWASGWLGAADLAGGDAGAAVPPLTLAVKGGLGQFTLALADALRRSGKVDEALATLAAAKGDDLASGLERARCLLDAGRPAEAQAALAELAAAYPANVEARYLLGFSLHAQRQWQGAAQELARAAALPDAPAVVKQGAQLANATLRAQKLLDAAVTVPAPPARR
ncbi:MAG TPA: tetratricopeptide repeat protein [Thermoanaerobaculaceae bacterium]|nr:tetratricopeptide repeat protein [Thermoanaerobaculaceae bacterium]